MLLALWCASFAIGIAVSVLGAMAVVPGVVVGQVIAGLGLLLGVAKRWPAVGGGLAWLGVGIGYAALARAPPALSAALSDAIASEEAVAIVARVIHGPEAAVRGARLTLEIEAIRRSNLGRNAGSRAGPNDGALGVGPRRLALSVISGWPDFGPGERLSFSARLRPVRGLCNPDLPDPTIALRSAGIDLLAGVGDVGAIQRLTPATRGWLARARDLAFRARRAMRAAIDRTLPGNEGAFLRTAVLGDRRGVSDTVEQGFRAAGATHVLSVSGLHLAAVAVLFLVGLRYILAAIPGFALYVDPRTVAALMALPAVAFFVLLTGEAVATLRSALMIGVALVGLLVNRPVSAPATLGAAGLALLLRSPLLLFDVSLQLSLASVTAIALLARSLGPRGPRPGGRGARAVHWLWRFGAATVAATAVTAPLCAHQFGEIAPAAPIGNLMLVPLVEMVVVPFGLAGAALAVVWPVIGGLALRIAGVAAHLSLLTAAGFAVHAPIWLCRAPNGSETVALVAAAVLLLGGVGEGRHARRRRRLWVAGGAAFLFAVISLGAREIARRMDPRLHVTFLDVGQGDAALIQAPGGRTVLVDGGGSFDGSFDPGERVIEPLLRARGIAALDLVALSHPHPDHLNGLLRILDRFPVSRLWTSGDDGHNPEYARLLSIARRHHVALPIPAPIVLGALGVTPLGPWRDDQIGAPEGLSVNDASLVLRLDFAGRAMVFPGDLEADGEGELVGRRALGERIDADVLKVPHHGSRTSSSQELIQSVAPALAVISLGWQNRFHFPDAGVVARYAARGTRVLRTDRDGAITVTVSPSGAIAVACMRGCPVSSLSNDPGVSLDVAGAGGSQAPGGRDGILPGSHVR